MLRFLLEKFRQAPGPMKQVRIIAADLAEEMLDLAGQYKRQFLGTEDEPNAPSYQGPDQWSPGGSEEPGASAPTPDPKPATASSDSRVASSVSSDIAPELTRAITAPANRKKQEFKVLAILWDASEHGLGALSAKEISTYGEKLGLSIRHENVRKVIRMRLKKHVIIRREPKGNSTIFHYRLSSTGNEYFVSKYLNH